MIHIRSVCLGLALSLFGGVALGQTDEGETAGPTVEQVQADTANWREVSPENLFIFNTTKGRVLIEAFPEVAPRHYAQFAAIIRSGDYSGTRFHRVIDGFMAQGGDIQAVKGRDSGLPNVEAEFTFKRTPDSMKFDLIGGPADGRQGYYKGAPVMTQSEFLAELTSDGQIESWVAHCPGTVSTARTDDPNSANSQFFLMRGEADWLDATYTAWGRMVDGLDNVLSIRTGEPPAQPDILQSTAVAADLPVEERPRVWVQRTDGPLFQAELATIEAETKVCDRPQVATVVEG